MKRSGVTYKFYAVLAVSVFAVSLPALADLSINPYPAASSSAAPAQEAPLSLNEESGVFVPAPAIEPQPAQAYESAPSGPSGLDSFDVDAYYAAFAKSRGTAPAATQQPAEDAFEVPEVSYEIEALSEEELAVSIPAEQSVQVQPIAAAPEKQTIDAVIYEASAPPTDVTRADIVRLEDAVEALRAELSNKEKLAAAPLQVVDRAADQEIEALKVKNMQLEAQLEAMKVRNEIANQERVDAIQRKTSDIEALKSRTQKLESEIEAAQKMQRVVATAAPPKPLMPHHPVSVDDYYEQHAARPAADRVPAQPLSASMSADAFVAEEFVMERPQTIADRPDFEAAAVEPAAYGSDQPAAYGSNQYAAERVFMSNTPLHQQWQTQSGKSVRAVLGEWSERAGVTLFWDTRNEYAVLKYVNIDDTYENAVSALLDQYSNNDVRPLGSLHIDPETGERFLVVQASNSL